MNRLRWIFQASATALLSLSAVMFAAAEENPLAGATVPLAIFCWLVIDGRGRAGIGSGWSLALAAAALAAALGEFRQGGIESRLLAPAHLLVYLIWLFLLQRKAPRHYWMLFGLCVLQVAVASLLTNDSWFGLTLITFAVLGFWTLAVFTLYRAALQVEVRVIEKPMAPEDAGARPTPERPTLQLSPARLLSAGSTARNAVHLDPGDRLIGAHFAGGALVMVILSLAISSAFFLLIPRVWISGFRMFDNSPIAGTRPLTGFTEQVTLGDMGEILENDDLVLQVELFDDASNAPIPLARYEAELGADPLFRGNSLELYRNGRWAQEPRRRWSGTPPYSPRLGALRERIRIEPIGTATLFGAGSVVTCRSHAAGEVIYRSPDSELFRRNDDADLRLPFQYDAIAVPHVSQPARRNMSYLGMCLQLPAEVERVVRHAQEYVTTHGNGGPPTAESRARLLEAMLRDSPDFRYSLKLSISDPDVDPLEDFVFNRREGHCEYFASALAIMLRGVGIPSRVITGFKGGLLNSRTGRLEVRQLHAHSWVEAYVESGWVTLDPTPPERGERVAELQEKAGGVWARWRERWLQTWNSGIRLSKSDQEQLVYNPLKATFASAWESLRDARGTSVSVAAFFRSLAESPERWFSWRGGLAVFLLLCLGAAVRSIVRQVLAAVRRMGGATRETGRAGRTVDFYERFRAIVERTGLERPLSETHREFAGHVSQRLEDRLQTFGLEEIPSVLTDAFYRVRYGDQTLSSEEQRAVAAQLDALERCCGQPKAS